MNISLKYALMVVLALAVASCARNYENVAVLSEIESYIKSNPDSAMTELLAFDSADLSKADKARHALLLSMAYDENDIYKVDFETLQPALDYYRNNGTATKSARSSALPNMTATSETTSVTSEEVREAVEYLVKDHKERISGLTALIS